MKFVVLLMCCLLASVSAFKINVQMPDASPLQCSICEYLVGEITDLLNANKSSADIITELGSDCQNLYNPPWITACNNIVNNDATQMIEFLQSNSPTSACSNFDFCEAAAVPQKKEAEPIKGEIECGVCTFVAAKVEQYIAENKTESEIVTELNKDCRVFRAKSWISVCDGLVDEFTPEMIQLAEAKYPADIICQDIKFCNASSAPVSKPAVGGEVECEVCDWLVTLGEHYATLNYTEDEIVHTMADSCDILIDSSFVAACKELVDSEGDAIVEYILNKENPTTICSQLGVCDNSTAAATTIAIAPAPVAAEVGDVECSVCEWLATIGEKFVSENKTEAEIVDALAKSCDLLIDKTWVSDCHSLVESDGDVIVQYLLNKETPEVICSEIGACSSSSRRIPVMAQVGGDVECSVCTWLTTLGERYVEENKTETEIVYALAKSCDILIDQSWINSCHALIIQEGDVIVQYLLNKEDPQVICQQIGACTNSSSSVPVVSVSNEKSVECSVCTWLATLGEHYVEQNKTESEILDSLSIACDVLIDEKWITECHDLVEEDGDVLVEYLLNKETPEVVCEQIDACPSNTTSSIPPHNSPLPVRTPLLSILLL